MSWYSQPIQPIDPVVISQTPKPPIRYMRDNFAATGQNSYVQPPAQDQSMWQSLINVQPITQGILNQRWGYNPFASDIALTNSTQITSASSPGSFIPIATLVVVSTAGFVIGQTVTVTGNTDPVFNGTWTILAVGSGSISLNFTALSASHAGTAGVLTLGTPIFVNRLYNFQSDSLGTRTIVAAGLPGVIGYNEDGTIYNGDIFVPTATTGIVRAITSRNYQYFCDGNNALDPATHRTGDSLKWDGSNTDGISNIGILTTDVTPNTLTGPSVSNTAGPFSPTTVTIVNSAYNAWTNPNGLTSSATFATVALNSTDSHSDVLSTTDFGFAIAPSTTIAGIVVTVFGSTTTTVARPQINISLTKDGFTMVGGGRTNTAASTDTTYTFGSATDLWGTTWAYSDIISNSFGAILQVNGSGTGGNTDRLQNVQITVYLGAGAGGSTTSGTGVGVVNATNGGDINLSIGRTYYLVANNSTTGHYSDLSVPSDSTGPLVNEEVMLLLTTYNDPQVDTKYLLATADGGDPSILYTAMPLVPGLTIASWAIDGANNVTFTGTWTGTPYINGATFYPGGLVHGAYMNGQLLTVTGSSPTTLVATFTHGADSATEPGVAGNYTYAIPNGVGLVVDNMDDPTLVLQQPLLFTDTFGDEFGLSLNTPPPAGNLILKHQGRLWMAGVPGATHSVFFSKSVTELTLPDGFIAGKYEEAWPGSNYFDVSDGAESVSGMLTDGTTLYIGTQSHIRRLLGNSPTNFQEPQIVHPEVGLLNQEVWQLTFMQGAPSGSIWMTPDFRVIQSDFNTYVDIGTPIQNLLNSLQPSAKSLAHASFVADGEFELYILAVPIISTTFCDTHLVFDLRARQWFVWKPTAGSLSLLFNITQAGTPQWLFLDGPGTNIDIYSSSATTDNGTTIPVLAGTTWLHFGEPTRRKMLNEIQVYGNTGMTVDIYGANNQEDFLSTPRPVVVGRTLMQSPFGTWNLYLTGNKTRYRYYQLIFNSSNGRVPLLGSYSVSVMALDDI